MLLESRPRILVLSTVFPHAGQPRGGLFVRARMFRVARHLPLVVVAPLPWFPLQNVLRRWRPHFRPMAPYLENQEGIVVYHPRFLSIPGWFKSFDGRLMAWCLYFTLKRLQRTQGFDIIDAHFAYPEGDAATLLGAWFKVPVTITLRGTEVPLSRLPRRRARMLLALSKAARIFSVAQALKNHVTALGVADHKIKVIGNGVDLEKFKPLPKAQCRAQLGIPLEATVLISVGGLVERKGFHRVIEILPLLRARWPNLLYLIVGGASAEGDMSVELQQQVATLGLDQHVRFLGALPPEELSQPLSAADIFVLATRNEGWANVFLEAMACGLPVVTTKVGGNAEVVATDTVGTLVDFGDAQALRHAIEHALQKSWDHAAIINYARANTWEQRVEILVTEFQALHAKMNTPLQ